MLCDNVEMSFLCLILVSVQPVNIVAGVCFIIGGALMAGAVDVAMLVVGRIFLGFGVGLCSLVSFPSLSVPTTHF